VWRLLTRPRPRPDLKVAYCLVWLVSVTPYITGLKTEQILTLKALREEKLFGKVRLSELSELPVSDSPLFALPPGSSATDSVP
jgi:hypothetical protein